MSTTIVVFRATGDLAHRDPARQAATIMVHGCAGARLPSIWGTQSQALLGSPSVASMVSG